MYRGIASRTDPLVMTYHYEQDVLEIDGRFAYSEQVRTEEELRRTRLIWPPSHHPPTR